MEAIMEAVDQSQYLSFCIADEEYAIGILQVKEIIEYDILTKVPHTPACIRGVINLRGSVVPVVDLAIKFGMTETQVTNRTCIVIVEVQMDGEIAVMGVMADAVSQVLDLGPEEIVEPPAFGARVRVDHLLGMGMSGKKFVMILDIDKVLATDELLAAISLQDGTFEELTEEEIALSETEQQNALPPLDLAGEEVIQPDRPVAETFHPDHSAAEEATVPS